MPPHSFPFPPDAPQGDWIVNLPANASIGEVIWLGSPVPAPPPSAPGAIANALAAYDAADVTAVAMASIPNRGTLGAAPLTLTGLPLYPGLPVLQVDTNIAGLTGSAVQLTPTATGVIRIEMEVQGDVGQFMEFRHGTAAQAETVLHYTANNGHLSFVRRVGGSTITADASANILGASATDRIFVAGESNYSTGSTTFWWKIPTAGTWTQLGTAVSGNSGGSTATQPIAATQLSRGKIWSCRVLRNGAPILNWTLDDALSTGTMPGYVYTDGVVWTVSNGWYDAAIPLGPLPRHGWQTGFNYAARFADLTQLRFTSDNDFTMACAFQSRASANVRMYLGRGAGLSSPVYLGTPANNNPRFAVNGTTATVDVAGEAAGIIRDTVPHVLIGRHSKRGTDGAGLITLKLHSRTYPTAGVNKTATATIGAAVPYFTVGQPLTIGNTDGINQRFYGWMAAVWNRLLTDTEVADIANWYSQPLNLEELS